MSNTGNPVHTWVECFKITLGSKRAYKKRLKELETWDTNGTETERQWKISALKHLIEQ